MRKLLNNPRFVIPLAVVALAFVAASLRSKRPVPFEIGVGPAGTQPGFGEGIAGDPELHPEAVATVLKDFVVPAAPADPFVSRLVESVQKISLPSLPDASDTVRLSAIWTQQGRTLVVINGQIHQAGDEIARLKIESADQEGVWLAHWKGRDFLTVGSSFTLRTPSAVNLEAKL